MNRVWKAICFALISMAIIAGCGDTTGPDELTVYLDRSFYLNVDETAKVEGENLRITLTDVIHDNRCPANADCVWPGTVQIELSFDTGGQNYFSTRLDLLAGADSVTLDLFSETALGYNFRFEEFLPYPQSLAKEAGVPIPPLERQAKLKITRKNLQPAVTGFVAITDSDPVMLKVDPFDLDSAWIVGDTLLLNITAGGGCERHYYFLFMSPAAFAKSNPAQADIYLRHFGNFDSCDGLLHPTLRFDISQIRHRYEQLYGCFDPIQLNMFDYFENAPGESRALTYATVEPLLPVGIGRYWIYDVHDPRFSINGGDYVDTITLIYSDFVDGKWWWYLEGTNPALVFGLSSFSYNADTVVTLESCGNYLVEGRRFIPLPIGSAEFVSSDCRSDNWYYAERLADTIAYQWCRDCSDAGTVRRIVPGIGIVSGGAISFSGSTNWTLSGYGIGSPK